MKDHETITASVSARNLRIYTALWSFLFGVLSASLINIPPLVCVLIFIVGLTVYFADKHVLVLIAIAGFAFGAFRYDIKDFHELAPAGNTGIVMSEPEKRESDTRFVVETDTGEKVLVSTDILSMVEYGDDVSLVGKAKALKAGSYADYLAKDDIFYTMDFAKVEVLSRGHGNPLRHALLGIKASFVEKMKDILPEPESSLLAGLVVSGKQALPKEILEKFRRAGVVHIVVLSGYNITIIAEFFLILFAFLGRRYAALASAAGIILFVVMSGASATVVRASIMVLLLLVGRVINRPGSAPRILLFTAFLMVMHNPKILLFDPSFQLSFLAMLALIYGTPMLQGFAERLLSAYGSKGYSQPIVFRLTEMLSVTLATQIFVFPYLLYNMGNFSTVFLISNLLILLVIPLAMLVGFTATLVAFVSVVLAWPLSFVAHLILKWILSVAHFLGNLSFASIQIENFPLWGSLGLYAVLGVILWKFRDHLKPSQFERL